MEDKKIIRMHYIHSEYVEIEVGDPDKSSLLDVYVDMLVRASMNGIILLEHPMLWYAHNSKNFQLQGDVDFIEMLKIFHDKKLVNLAIGLGEVACNTLQMARCLIETNRLLENPIILVSSHGTTFGDHCVSTTLHSLHPRKKMSTTSARRRGLYVPKYSKYSRSSGSEPTSGSVSRTKDCDLVSHVPIVIAKADEKVAYGFEGKGVIVASQNDELVEGAVISSRL